MKISIIIPVYNTSPYLRECLDSIFTQDYRTCEVICVNDGSTDNSLDILNEYQLRFPDNMIVLSQSNQGQAAARNAALDVATGDYVLFLDSDDYYYPNAIQTATSLICEYPDADFFYMDCAITSENERYFTLPNTSSIQMSLQSYYDFEYKHYNSTPKGCVCGGMYKRAFIERNHLRMKAGVRYEDELFIFQLFLQEGTCVAIHLDNPFYYYRLSRVGSTTYAYTLSHFIDRRNVIHLCYNAMMEPHLCSESRKYKIFRLCEENVIQAYLSGFASYIHNFFNGDDLTIMKQCVLSDRDKRLLFLSRLSPKLMAAYRTDSLPTIVRRFINRFL